MPSNDLEVRLVAAVTDPKDEVIEVWTTNVRTGIIIPELQPEGKSVF